MSEFLNNIPLNKEQLEAVSHLDGPMLVLAGAGTGKTRVLTTRVANIIKQSAAYPSEILAVTFTNKAAKEMQHRINMLTDYTGSINSGTFHSISARILRNYAEIIGLTSNFTIIDSDDQIKVIKSLMTEKGMDIKKIAPKLVASIISRWKDSGFSHDSLPSSSIVSEAQYFAKKIYSPYQNKLHSSNLCDFGDLILYNTKIFLANPSVLEFLQNKFKYILIDEYQDTNSVQYLWARLLTGERKNICCVGDDDQSIYSWRGAEIANILRFEKDFPGAKVIKLEQNYRSTSKILEAASSLIKHNPNRHSKTLWTNSEDGDPVKLISCYNDYEEARFVANSILNDISYSKFSAKDIAVLVRAGFQTRAFEESFISSNIKYKIIGGLKFYERAEIKDVISYLRLILNHNDDVAFERIINVPKRSIGPSTILQIKTHAHAHNTSYFNALSQMVENKILKSKALNEAMNFLKLIHKFASDQILKNKPYEFINNLVSESHYKTMLKLENTDESRGRLDNINELLRAAGEYNTIYQFLEHISLVMDNDSAGDFESEVSLMTIHAAKGLEFECVYIPGMEEGLFPHQKSLGEMGESGVEEERRIAYVAITRAKKNLIISYAEKRRMYNEIITSVPSRFLAEINLLNAQKTTSTNYYNSINFSQKRSNYPTQNRYIKETPPEISDPLRPGARVTHNSFGGGIILKKNGDNLEIFFESSGIKTIRSSFVSPAV